MAKVSLLSAKSKTGFQSFVLVIHHLGMKLNQDALREAIQNNSKKTGKKTKLNIWALHTS